MNPIPKGERILFYFEGRYIEGIVEDFFIFDDILKYKIKLFDNSEMIIQSDLIHE